MLFHAYYRMKTTYTYTSVYVYDYVAWFRFFSPSCSFFFYKTNKTHPKCKIELVKNKIQMFLLFILDIV
jgi:hypothetical protein